VDGEQCYHGGQLILQLNELSGVRGHGGRLPHRGPPVRIKRGRWGDLLHFFRTSVFFVDWWMYRIGDSYPLRRIITPLCTLPIHMHLHTCHLRKALSSQGWARPWESRASLSWVHLALACRCDSVSGDSSVVGHTEGGLSLYDGGIGRRWLLELWADMPRAFHIYRHPPSSQINATTTAAVSDFGLLHH
jgi:hypothetical protein